ncbi:MAG: carbamoyltransferase [Bacteroidota bacterium]
MVIVGISAYYHDSAAAIIEDGNIIAAVQEERFTRIKHDPSFPSNAIQYCLDESGYKLSEVDAIVFYDKPFLKFERLLETYYGFAPKGVGSFIRSIPIWVKEKLFLKRTIRKELNKIEDLGKKSINLLFPEHHLSHAASAFYPSPFEESAILTIDGVGEWATASICSGRGKEIKIHKELRFPHSLGLLYSSFTYFLGFKVNSGEYKMMGLAPYGNPSSDNYATFYQIIKDQLIEIKEDGSIRLNQKYFNYATGFRMVFDRKWEGLFGIKRRTPKERIEQIHMDLALVIQAITEEIVILMAREAKRISGSENLCLAGGVALNCVANGRLMNENIFQNVWIQPAAGDAGGALGAALTAYYIFYDQEMKTKDRDLMKGSYLGPVFADFKIEQSLKRYKAKFKKYSNLEETCKACARLVSEGNVIGWHQGRMEFGPRALGNRSILGDPRSEEMQKKLNLKIKYRESFRPFAPAVLRQDVNEYFEHNEDSPYMLIVKKVQQDQRLHLPKNYHSLDLLDKLNVNRSKIPAITHVDFSARIQTVDGEYNPEFHMLLEEFKAITGTGMLINTSFNVRGEPIVCTPEDAYRCFMRTEMDYLVIGNYIFEKTSQPEWDKKDKWQEKFKLD